MKLLSFTGRMVTAEGLGNITDTSFYSWTFVTEVTIPGYGRVQFPADCPGRLFPARNLKTLNKITIPILSS